MKKYLPVKDMPIAELFFIRTLKIQLYYPVVWEKTQTSSLDWMCSLNTLINSDKVIQVTFLAYKTPMKFWVKTTINKNKIHFFKTIDKKISTKLPNKFSENNLNQISKQNIHVPNSFFLWVFCSCYTTGIYSSVLWNKKTPEVKLKSCPRDNAQDSSPHIDLG
jgi:hypothetical protein